MKYLDEICAWLIFLEGVRHIVLTELFHARGAVLDTGLLLIFLAMFNLLRIRNGSEIKLLRVFCLGANVSELMFEIVRSSMIYRLSNPSDAILNGVLALFILVETVFSMIANPVESAPRPA